MTTSRGGLRRRSIFWTGEESSLFLGVDYQLVLDMSSSDESWTSEEANGDRLTMARPKSSLGSDGLFEETSDCVFCQVKSLVFLVLVYDHKVVMKGCARRVIDISEEGILNVSSPRPRSCCYDEGSGYWFGLGLR